MECQEHLDAAAEATTESGSVDFKSAFDPAQRGDCCELIKDIVAMANSGEGVIVLGLADDGSRSTWETKVLTELNPAQIVDQLRNVMTS
ncbi:MAG: ATP-binding protein [Phycisphaeraceae bacterium]|nr:ATP-binding protein [Phycisphaeraceae bacterium]